MADAHSPLHQFVIEPIVSLPVFGVDLAFTNSALWMAIAALTAIGFFAYATGPRAIVPDRAQMMAESM